MLHIREIYKDGTDEPICRAAVEMQTENRLMDPEPGGTGEGEGGTNGERSMET